MSKSRAAAQAVVFKFQAAFLLRADGLPRNNPCFQPTLCSWLRRVCSKAAVWLHKAKKAAFNFSPREITPFSNTPRSHGVYVQGRPKFDQLNSPVSPHLNLELGLGVCVRTLANQIRSQDKAAEYQIPNEANWCAPERLSWVLVKTTELPHLLAKDTAWNLPVK